MAGYRVSLHAAADGEDCLVRLLTDAHGCVSGPCRCAVAWAWPDRTLLHWKPFRITEN